MHMWLCFTYTMAPHLVSFTQASRHRSALSHTNVGMFQASGYVMRVLFKSSRGGGAGGDADATTGAWRAKAATAVDINMVLLHKSHQAARRTSWSDSVAAHNVAPRAHRTAGRSGVGRLDECASS